MHLFSPTLLNTLRLGWNRFSQFQEGRDADVNPATIGFDTGVTPQSYGIPEIHTYGYANLGLQYGAGGRVATSYQIADDVSWTRGNHALKFGFNFLHNYGDYTLAGGRGSFRLPAHSWGTS